MNYKEAKGPKRASPERGTEAQSAEVGLGKVRSPQRGSWKFFKFYMEICTFSYCFPMFGIVWGEKLPPQYLYWRSDRPLHLWDWCLWQL